MELKVAELFAGVGGFRVGLNHITSINGETGKAEEHGNWEFVWANQYEPSTKKQHAYECYSIRFGKNSCSNEDINLVDKTTIPDHTLLVGGFPCQDYSVARSLNNEKGITGKKGVLFWAIKDVLKTKKTPFVLLENVDRLLKSPAKQRGRDFAIMLKTFDTLGYSVIWRVINAGEYGMPQKRRRVFIFAFRNDTPYAETIRKTHTEKLIYTNILNKNFPIVEKDYKIQTCDLNGYEDIVNVSEKFNGGKFLTSGIMNGGIVHHLDITPLCEPLHTLGDIIATADRYCLDKTEFIIENEKLDAWKYMKGAKKIERTAQNGHKYIYSEGNMTFPDKLDEPARTMLTSEGTTNRSSHIIYDAKLEKYRILSPVECELIQMFPPHWTDTMPSRRRYFMMGNALVCGVIARLEKDLRTIITNA